MKKLFAFAAALALAGSAFAAPNVANPAQKGSLLIFPDIDVTDGRTTIIRLGNDQTSQTWVKCYYMDVNKVRNDFVFLITPGQPVWWDVYTGDGTVGANNFPGTVGRGMLACWAVTARTEIPRQFNQLYGTATVIDYGLGVAYEYNAYAFYRRAAGNSFDQTPIGPGLLLNGTNYDYCPQYVVGNFHPFGTTFAVDPDAYVPARGQIDVGLTRITLMGCNIDLRQQYVRFNTKFELDVWRENELKLTGAYECADGWHEILLGPNGANIDQQGDNFSRADLKGPIGRFRATPSVDNVICPAAFRPTYEYGVLGVQATQITLEGGEAWHGTNLAGVGMRPGFIGVDPSQGTSPDGVVR